MPVRLGDRNSKSSFFSSLQGKTLNVERDKDDASLRHNHGKQPFALPYQVGKPPFPLFVVLYTINEISDLTFGLGVELK